MLLRDAKVPSPYIEELGLADKPLAKQAGWRARVAAAAAASKK